MVRFIRAEQVIDELHNRMIEVTMCHVSGDLENAGKYKGLEEALKIVTDIIHGSTPLPSPNQTEAKT